MRISDWSSDVCSSDLLSNRFVWACLFVTGGFAAVGFMDDLDKVTKGSHRGIPGRVRLLLEFIIAGIAVLLIVSRTGTDLYLPFLSDIYIPLRSEEHTSELQSLMRISYAVFCLKKKKYTPPYMTKLPSD